MSVTVFVEFPLTEDGAQQVIAWANSDDGEPVTKKQKGFKSVQSYLAQDNKTVMMVMEWDSIEDHQAYYRFRQQQGVDEFIAPLLEGEIKVLYATAVQKPKDN